MPTQPIKVTEAGVSMAALQFSMALMMRLVEKGVLTNDEGNEIAAGAASQCQAAHCEEAANIIKMMIPTSANIDPVAAAKARGVTVETKD